jgi:hypothetical protein
VVLLGPWGAFTEPRRPLTFSWSLEGTPDRPLCRPMRCPPSFHRSGTGLRLTFEPKDFNVALPVRTRRAEARECLPSYRELASRNPQAEPANTFLIISGCSAHRFAFSPLVPASGGASSFLLASALSIQQALRPPGDKTRDASDRLLPPKRITCTRTSCVPDSLRDFHRVDTPRSLGLRRVVSGDRVFHDTRERFGGSPLDTRCHLAPLPSVPSPVR